MISSKVRRIVIVLSGIVYALCRAAAIEVGWHPDMVIAVGDGVTLDHPEVAAFPGLVLVSPTPTNLSNGWQSEAVTFAQNTYDMVKTLSFNSAVGVNNLFTSGNIDVSFFSHQTFDENTLTYVFTKTRDFGTTLYSPTGFCSAFTALVPVLQKTLVGEALHARITSTFGTHYVRGYNSEAFVAVVYKLHYASATVRQSLNVSASGSALDSASFSGFVNAFFGSTNTAATMDYQFYSSDPTKSPPFPDSGPIQHYGQFTNFVNQLEGYVNSMTSGNAKITAYVLDPIATVPGYLPILGGYVPPPIYAEDSSDFVRVYSALQVWNQRLSAAANEMSWLNAQGQQVVLNKAADITGYLGALDQINSNHYTLGSPLYLPADVVTYLANMSDIRLPQIYIMDTFADSDGVTDWRYIIGRVDCGDRNLVKAQPFLNLAELYYGTNNGTSATINYDPVDFQLKATNNVNAASRYKDTTGTYDSTAIKRFSNTFQTELWACITNPAANPDLNGFFLARQAYNKAPLWSLAVRDENGTNVDVMSFLDTRSGGCGSSGMFSNAASVVMSVTPSPSGTVGLGQPVTFQVTNQSSIQCYGTTVSFVLGNGFDYVGASGTQGSASFNSSNRVVTCAVGPLLGNSTATINVQLIPLQTNAVPGATPSLALGSGLTNTAPVVPSPFPPIASALPVLSLSRAPTGILLDWWSDTDRLLVESSSAISSASSWAATTNGVIPSSSHRFLPVSLTGLGFFRLHTY
jgi:hypothetical protein